MLNRTNIVSATMIEKRPHVFKAQLNWHDKYVEFLYEDAVTWPHQLPSPQGWSKVCYIESLSLLVVNIRGFWQPWDGDPSLKGDYLVYYHETTGIWLE